MLTLAVDTALEACQAVVLDGETVLASRCEPMARGHQERLAPLVAQTMAEAGRPFSALDRVGVTLGPGSFTGLRVGLAFAKGISVALRIPCVGVGTLAALAAGAAAPGLTAAAIDARRGRVYLQLFRGREALGEAESVAIGEAAAAICTARRPGEPLSLVGPGADLLETLGDAAIGGFAWPDVAALGHLVLVAATPARRPKPLYLRGADALTIAERAAAAAR